ncbi:ferredoxin [Patescibacteria group bacterium]
MPKTVVVDPEKCIGCGTCASLAAKSFKMEGGKSIALEKPADDETLIQSAIDSCPVDAISWKDN